MRFKTYEMEGLRATFFIEPIRFFLSLNDVLPNEINKDGKTLLSIKVEENSEAVVRLLLGTSKP